MGHTEHRRLKHADFPGGSAVENLPTNAGDWGLIPGLGRSLKTDGSGYPLQCSSWRIPWTEEPGGLPSMGLQRVGQD